MNALEEIICAEIEAYGPLSVARFMQLALQHPQHGYYVKGDPLGHKGDFITSPEISQMFGEMVGLWCAEVWRQMGSPPAFALLEVGPGRGTLMQDALQATRKISGFHNALQLHLFESNKTLRAIQAERLEPFAPCFIDDLDSLPSLPLIAVANEFFDAMPIHQYSKTEEGWRERLVGWNGTRLTWTLGFEEVLLPLPDDFLFYEISPQAVSLTKVLAKNLAIYGGAALIVDYGYAQPAGQDTLQAVSGHAFADPLARPGEMDLTAHVDFEALRHAAQKQGANASQTITQGAFLRAMGIELRAEQLKIKATSTQTHDIQAALQRLTEEAQMGTLFKVLALTGKEIRDVPGFP